MDMQVPQTQLAAPLYLIALASCAPDEEDGSAEGAWLRAQYDALSEQGDVAAQMLQWHETPNPQDERLVRLAAALRLTSTEVLAVAMSCAAETDPMVGRVLAWLQAPVGGARPTLGLIASLAERIGADGGFAALAGGPARASGLLQFDAETRALPEAALHVPLPIVFALTEAIATMAPPGVRIGLSETILLPPSIRSAAEARARALTVFEKGGGGLVVRSGHPREARAVAAQIAASLGARAAFIEGDAPPGFGPWLMLSGCLPVLCVELAPGDRKRLPDLGGWTGPWLIATGPDGSFERDGEPLPAWRVPVPPAAERVALWEAATGKAELAQHLGVVHRHPAGRIAELARAGRFQARLEGQEAPEIAHVSMAARAGANGDLGTMTELLSEEIPDDVLVLPPNTRRELEALARRCVARDTLADELGPASRTRYRPGARALLVGPSGTGKTLAVGWLATRLGLPLYRVDLASITSKYIGETEKNLAQLFARAEHAEVVLMFDEADSLFGKRTDVKEANDRFANQQTNYLLQRIESFEGIAILTSNSRARFDTAFTRRLDAIIEFTAPGPEERRALWLAHLGKLHTLDHSQINRVAASCDLAGGHIRNATLAAAARNGGRIDFDTLCAAVVSEYRKLGRQVPAGL